MSDYVTLNVSMLEDTLRDQGLKRYWVAEVAGIHKTTLRRWLTGRIRRMDRRRVARVAEVLSLPQQTLILDSANGKMADS